MRYELVFTDSYLKRAKRFFKKHPQLLSQYEKVLGLLELNPFHNSLRTHKLQGALSALHSVSINMQYRITLEILIQENQLLLINIGDHDQVYS
jgi:addiction module RelE/StbE family toxin